MKHAYADVNGVRLHYVTLNRARQSQLPRGSTRASHGVSCYM